MSTYTLRKHRVGAALGLAVGGLVGGIGAGVATAASYSGESIQEYQVDATLSGDTLSIVETIDYDFGINSRHGIFREVDLGVIDRPDERVTLENATVASDTAADDLEETPGYSTTTMRVGDPNQTYMGLHRYQIGYDLVGVPDPASSGRLVYVAIGDRWDVPISDVTIRVAPDFEPGDVTCSLGSNGDFDPCEVSVSDGVVTAQVPKVEAGRGVALDIEAGEARTPAELTPPGLDLDGESSPWVNAGLAVGGAAAGAGALGSVLAGRWVRRAGADRTAAFHSPSEAAFAPLGPAGPAGTPYPWTTGPGVDTTNLAGPLTPGPGIGTTSPEPGVGAALGSDPSAAPAGGVGTDPGGPAPAEGAEGEVISDVEAERQVTIQFVPPEGLTPSQGAVLLREQVDDPAKTAWLAQAVIDDWIALEGDPKHPTITHTEKADRDPAHMPAPLGVAFAGRRSVELGSYDEDFAAAWTSIGGQLESWRTTSGLWDQHRGTRNKVRAFGLLALAVLGVLAVGFALIAGLGQNLALAVPAAAVAGLLLGAGVRAAAGTATLDVRNPGGFGLWLRTEGFRRFLHESEGEHARWAAENGLLREYSAWAVALGELDRWNRAASLAGIPPTDPGMATTLWFVGMHSTVHSTSTAPRSSGSGGFSGGGFSGGGFSGGVGGGGGGSW